MFDTKICIEFRQFNNRNCLGHHVLGGHHKNETKAGKNPDEKESLCGSHVEIAPKKIKNDEN